MEDKKKQTGIRFLILFLSLVIISKFIFYYSDDIIMHTEQIVYDYVTSNFKSISVTEIDEKYKSNEKAIVYIGSRNCGDCRYTVHEINNIKTICDAANIEFYYNNLDNNTTMTQIEFIKNVLNTKTIPAVIIINNKKYTKLEYDNLVNNRYWKEIKEIT